MGVSFSACPLIIIWRGFNTNKENKRACLPSFKEAAARVDYLKPIYLFLPCDLKQCGSFIFNFFFRRF